MKAMAATLGPVMLDVVGTRLSEDDIRRIRHPLTGGVILFARNYENREQLCELTAAIHEVRPGVLIAVDHEGGRVQRFKTDGFTKLPPMSKLGQLWDRDVFEATKAATDIGFVLAAELRACGVDLSFTPVLDLDHGQSGVIGDRAFHRDARVVTMLAKSLNHGLALAGMANCGKHFPGHGYAEADSHVAIPVDERDLEKILAEDAALPEHGVHERRLSVIDVGNDGNIAERAVLFLRCHWVNLYVPTRGYQAAGRSGRRATSASQKKRNFLGENDFAGNRPRPSCIMSIE